jgi:hypothetical protein
MNERLCGCGCGETLNGRKSQRFVSPRPTGCGPTRRVPRHRPGGLRDPPRSVSGTGVRLLPALRRGGRVPRLRADLGQRACGVWGRTTGRQRREAQQRRWEAARLLEELDG